MHELLNSKITVPIRTNTVDEKTRRPSKQDIVVATLKNDKDNKGGKVLKKINEKQKKSIIKIVEEVTSQSKDSIDEIEPPNLDGIEVAREIIDGVVDKVGQLILLQ